MNASKENAKTANEAIEKAAILLDESVPDKAQRDKIKRHLCNAQNFIEAAERKLPREASFGRDRIKKTDRGAD